MTDHYATLGVAKNASQDEIKKAFRRLASQHHPDKGGDTAKFQQIQAAYDTLGDADKRAAYDNPAPQFGGFGQGAQFGNMHDIFSQMFGGGGFGGFPGQHPRRNHVRMSLWISLLDVARGGRRPVALGTQSGTNTIEIEIPLGIEDGDNVQYSGIAPGGQDLVIQFRVHPDPRFRREGLNLYTDQKISIWDMLLGADAEVRNIEGHGLMVKIPPRTQPGTTLRLRQQGLRDRNGQRGDLMVKIQPEFPASIAPEIISAIEQHR
jgi:DnaJ-class molecular chaperone